MVRGRKRLWKKMDTQNNHPKNQQETRSSFTKHQYPCGLETDTLSKSKPKKWDEDNFGAIYKATMYPSDLVTAWSEKNWYLERTDSSGNKKKLARGTEEKIRRKLAQRIETKENGTEILTKEGDHYRIYDFGLEEFDGRRWRYQRSWPFENLIKKMTVEAVKVNRVRVFPPHVREAVLGISFCVGIVALVAGLVSMPYWLPRPNNYYTRDASPDSQIQNHESNEQNHHKNPKDNEKIKRIRSGLY